MACKAIFALASFLVLAPTAAAQDVRLEMFVTGNDLYDRCTESTAASTYVANYAFCRGYIYAAADFYGTVAAENGRPSCRRAGVTGQQIVDIVIKYLRDHPEERHKPANYSVIAVIPSLMVECGK